MRTIVASKSIIEQKGNDNDIINILKRFFDFMYIINKHFENLTTRTSIRIILNQRRGQGGFIQPPEKIKVGGYINLGV